MRSTELLVLGVAHLRGDSAAWQGLLDGVHERLVRWGPAAVAVEVLAGEQMLWQSLVDPDWESQQVVSVTSGRDAARIVAGLHDWDLVQARSVALDPATSAPQRVIAWMAAFEPFTALLHAAGINLPSEVAEYLAMLRNRGGEAWLIGGVVAERLGLGRLYPFDDFTDHQLDDQQAKRLSEVFYPHELRREASAKVHRWEDQARRAGSLWPMYRAMDTAEELDASTRLESANFLNAADPGDAALGRLRLAQWRSRNLHMAAHLRMVWGRYPGRRVLAVVGHSHLAPLRAALRDDQWDLELATAADLDA